MTNDEKDLARSACDEFLEVPFYQMCSIIRRFKGVLPADGATGSTSVDIAGDFSVWQSVSPVFTDFEGDTTHRDSTDTTGTIRYINTTGRNDIVESRLTADSGMVYAYVRTAEAITSYKDGTNWMLLFIDADNNKSTGWEGYDYLVNYSVIDDTHTTLCTWRDGVWQEIGTVAYRVEGNQLMVALPRSLMGLTDKDLTLQFHWMDNVTNLYDLSSWFTTGDSAPERRNNYSITLSVAYDAAAETLLGLRESGAVSEMPSITLTDEQLETLTEGLLVTGYRLSAKYGKMPTFRLIEANATGTCVVKAVTANAFSDLRTDYALAFEGYLLLETGGTQTFTLTCDDGARLYIDQRLVLECPYADGRKDGQTVTESISLPLAAGYHSVRVEYAEVTGGGATLSLDAPGRFYASAAVGEGLILREDFDVSSTSILKKNFELEAEDGLKPENGWLVGAWIEGRAIRYRGSDLRFYSMETRIIAEYKTFAPHRSAIALRLPAELSLSNVGGMSAFEPDNGDGDSTSYLGTSGIYLYCAGNALEVAVHVKDASRQYGVASIGYPFSLPSGTSFATGAVIRFEDLGDTVRIFCEDTLLATVVLSDVGQVDGQPFSGNGYRHAVLLDADGNTVLTSDGYECLIPVEGDCGVLERNNSFKLDYIELWQFAYALGENGYVAKN